MASVPYYEYIVVGCGGIGSGAVYWLSKTAGKGVLGLEQFKLGHENGGSQDHSRIIRLMYHDEKYTRLTPHTYTAWEEVEREAGVQLVFKTGGLDFARKGTPQEDTIAKYGEAMRRAGIPFENMDGDEISRRFPQFNLSKDFIGFYQKDGGLVDAALGNAVHIQLARGHGATVLDECGVTWIEKTSGGALVHTNKGTFRCRKIIVAAGAWINHVLGTIGVHVPVTVTQEQVTYLSTPHVKDFTKKKFPIWIYNAREHDIYGLPSHVNAYSKIGVDAGGPSVLPETRTYNPDPTREKVCIDFFKSHIPKAVGPPAYTKTCLYTMPPDRNFVIDSLKTRGWPEVVICCGAGHAYKFASLLGKILSQLAIDGRTEYPISDFTFEREAIINPNYKAGVIMGRGGNVKLSSNL
ncbi:unnamed protein product [Owenia fusiformis]|uniref:FAD dependent oxidoreductase domain-containing protein n=1 Tax=Owenia fusiformis TaxID=6347 RepID=A0A8J1Y7G5_OWEFU|nr:unnamed protein product [Owenia fusiformis]